MFGYDYDTVREVAIQIITPFVGGLIAVVFANFVVNAYHFIKRHNDLWW